MYSNKILHPLFLAAAGLATTIIDMYFAPPCILVVNFPPKKLLRPFPYSQPLKGKSLPGPDMACSFAHGSNELQGQGAAPSQPVQQPFQGAGAAPSRPFHQPGQPMTATGLPDAIGEVRMWSAEAAEKAFQSL